MEIGERIKMLRKQHGLTQKELAERCGYNSLTTINKIELGINTVPISTVEKIAKVFNVSPSYLMGWDDKEILKHQNVSPLSKQKIPLLGSIACGKPIYAAEDRESYVEVGTEIKADFCVKAQGDSMINARIKSGDIVFIRQQPMVENGEIAAVLIDDLVTLKRIYYEPNKQKIILNAENPKYPPMIYDGSDLEKIKILGKAVAFESDID